MLKMLKIFSKGTQVWLLLILYLVHIHCVMVLWLYSGQNKPSKQDWCKSWFITVLTIRTDLVSLGIYLKVLQYPIRHSRHLSLILSQLYATYLFLEVSEIQGSARFPIPLLTPIPNQYLQYLAHTKPTPYLPIPIQTDLYLPYTKPTVEKWHTFLF